MGFRIVRARQARDIQIYPCMHARAAVRVAVQLRNSGRRSQSIPPFCEASDNPCVASGIARALLHSGFLFGV